VDEAKHPFGRRPRRVGGRSRRRFPLRSGNGRRARGRAAGARAERDALGRGELRGLSVVALVRERVRPHSVPSGTRTRSTSVRSCCRFNCERCARSCRDCRASVRAMGNYLYRTQGVGSFVGLEDTIRYDRAIAPGRGRCLMHLEPAPVVNAPPKPPHPRGASSYGRTPRRKIRISICTRVPLEDLVLIYRVLRFV